MKQHTSTEHRSIPEPVPVPVPVDVPVPVVPWVPWLWMPVFAPVPVTPVPAGTAATETGSRKDARGVEAM